MGISWILFSPCFIYVRILFLNSISSFFFFLTKLCFNLLQTESTLNILENKASDVASYG